MSGWNFNMNEAPRGYYEDVTRKIGGNTTAVQKVHRPVQIIAAGNDGVVTISRWLDAQGRWEMFTKDTPPLAWQPWPNHPHSEAKP